MKFIIILILSLISVNAKAQSVAFPGPGLTVSAASYQGPGDVAGQAALVWGSCARAYNAAYANGTNSLCDLQDATTGTVAICTLRAATTGFVDLTGGYCTGGLAPAAACAAAAGGACIVSKIYNQVSPGTLDFTQATLANKPAIIFNSINGLPSINCATGAATQLSTTSSITASTPLLFNVVYMRNANFTTQQGIFGPAGGISMGPYTSANTAYVNGGIVISIAASDNAWHSLFLMINTVSTTGAYRVDATDTSPATIGTSTISAQPIRFCRANAIQSTGSIAVEGGLWTTSADLVSRSSIYTNQHGANGYNGAF